MDLQENGGHALVFHPVLHQCTVNLPIGRTGTTKVVALVSAFEKGRLKSIAMNMEKAVMAQQGLRRIAPTSRHIKPHATMGGAKDCLCMATPEVVNGKIGQPGVDVTGYVMEARRLGAGRSQRFRNSEALLARRRTLTRLLRATRSLVCNVQMADGVNGKNGTHALCRVALVCSGESAMRTSRRMGVEDHRLEVAENSSHAMGISTRIRDVQWKQPNGDVC